MKQCRKATMMLIDSQARLVEAEIFATLKEIVVKKHTGREKERLCVRAEESRRKILLAMTDGQAAHADEVLRSCFVGWKKHRMELRKEKIHHKQLVAFLVSGQDSLALQATFHEWHSHASHNE